MPLADLASAIRGFFEQHLISQRGLSGHTVLAYRDAMKLLLAFACRLHRKDCIALTLAHLDEETIRRFLRHLEEERHNCFTRPYTAVIHGKGAKQRVCPLWRETIDAVRRYLAARSTLHPDTTSLFLNTDGRRLTRFGVRYIVAHRIADAAKTCPSLLCRKISPHTWRHSTALHLLQSNVDLTMISAWLGPFLHRNNQPVRRHRSQNETANPQIRREADPKSLQDRRNMDIRQEPSDLALLPLIYVQRFTQISQGIPSNRLVPVHIDRLVTFYYDPSEVSTHIRTKLKIPARG